MPVAETKVENSAEQQTQIFHSILVATDFSEASRRALFGAAKIAAANDAHLSVVNVFHTDWRYEMQETPPEIDLERNDAQEKLDAEIRALHSKKKIDSILVRQQPVAQAVTLAAANLSADLLVIGTRGRTGLLKIALGSVGEELLRMAPCPVMCIGPKATIGASSLTSGFRTILFATDFGEGSKRALPLVLRLSQGKNTRLVLLHVIPPMPATSTTLSAYAAANAAGDELQEWETSSRTRSQQQLQRWFAAHATLDREPQFVVAIDLLPEGILRAAARFKADLIIMGANRVAAGRFASHLPWTAVHHVIHDALCPVLTVAG